jgi:Fur family transcriptional regulator, ferric uptake regulator
MATSTVDRQVEGQLRQHGIRYTTGRRAVISALAGAEGPRSAAELHADLAPAVPLSSLYRSLTVLEEAGVLAPHHGTKGLTRYEIAEWLAGHHHHLVCVSCGSVEDIEIPEDHERRLRDLISDVAAAASFMPSDHSLEIEGRCARCA